MAAHRSWLASTTLLMALVWFAPASLEAVDAEVDLTPLREQKSVPVRTKDDR